MINKIGLFLGVMAVPVVILLMTIHTRWLLFSTTGGIVLVGVIYMAISPAGTGHVADNLVSYVVFAILAILFAVTTQKALDRPAPPHKSSKHAALMPGNHVLWPTPYRVRF